MTEELPVVFGSVTDLFLRKQIQKYREETECGKELMRVIEYGSRIDVEREWVWWVSGLDGIEDGIICLVSLDWEIMNRRLYHSSSREMRHVYDNKEVRIYMSRCVRWMNWVLDLIECRVVEGRLSRGDEVMVETCKKVAWKIIRMVSVRRGFEAGDRGFYEVDSKVNVNLDGKDVGSRVIDEEVIDVDEK